MAGGEYSAVKSKETMAHFQPVMSPAPGERRVAFVGDRLSFSLRSGDVSPPPAGWRGLLRTNLGRGAALLDDILRAHATGAPPAGAAWRDLPMRADAQGWSLTLPMVETGFFKAKAYALDAQGRQHWPSGPDFGLSVQPDFARTANTIYCAFARLYGQSRLLPAASGNAVDSHIKPLDSLGYSVIPPSGKLRDLIHLLPHITGTLGCRVLHLLPVCPTPTTFARFGRFGSPYAAQDLAAIDPALVVFDKRTTGVDQFRELAYATHCHGARFFLDIVINHTGWGSTLFEEHPDWFKRQPDGTFHSPGAWGNTWEDLVELNHDRLALWDAIAESLVTWCRRGVDGFRCDAGYMVPLPAWQYIIARVRQEFPDALFLLEGLGGAWEATAALLGEGGMQWAYSELFQNYSGVQVSGYLDHAWRQSRESGSLVHYSETHDNARLAAHPAGGAWSLLRNRLCALASPSGCFGFTGGVEWLAQQKIDVHDCTGLNWGASENLLDELARLNRLLANHPAFFDGAQIVRLSAPDSPVLAFTRTSAEGLDSVLVLVNLDVECSQRFTFRPTDAGQSAADWRCELLGQALPEGEPSPEGAWVITMPPAAVVCLAPTAEPRGLAGDAYREARARAAWAMQALHVMRPDLEAVSLDWRELAALVERSPGEFLMLGGKPASPDHAAYPCVVHWSLADRNRVVLVPPAHWLLIESEVPFRATLEFASESSRRVHAQSFIAAGKHFASFPPRQAASDATLSLERSAEADQRVSAAIRYLAPEADLGLSADAAAPTDVVLLTNGRGGMARLRVDLGRVESKYDCALGANLHPTLPVDRHVFVKRVRAWINADGFIAPLDCHNLTQFNPGPPAIWRFTAQAGDGRTVEVQLAAEMVAGCNTTAFCFTRPAKSAARGRQLPDDAVVRLVVRVDLEDRGFHSETHRNGGADHHFNSHTQTSQPGAGFTFRPAVDRQLHVFADAGEFHPQPEWSEGIPHPVEASRGQAGAGDAWSPGWFELPLGKGQAVDLVLCADANDPTGPEIAALSAQVAARGDKQVAEQGPPAGQGGLGARLTQAAKAYVVRRDEGKTVIAGYPWFLDWGRDTLICARGLLAAGWTDPVREILLTFARFEERGTLPNIIHGEHVGNRDTTDAPLWFAVVAEEWAKAAEAKGGSPLPWHGHFAATSVPDSQRTLADVLASIASHYLRGTPNGIRMDAASGLIWSPAHFTWMDTNYPAGTPREGYPVEIQCLWIRLLRLLDQLAAAPVGEEWAALAARVESSLDRYFWLPEKGWFADVLLAPADTPAANAVPDDALRSNCLFTVSLGLVADERARRCVEAARRWLVVPGALRSLAPLPVNVPLAIRSSDGRMLNDPSHPFWGRYEGDEDTRRKPAYHNGTAWTWTFPVFCEALARAWGFSPESVAAARAYLGSMGRILNEGCLGQIPEILDGDAPHQQRGCDAQAWGVTEALRVATLLE